MRRYDPLRKKFYFTSMEGGESHTYITLHCNVCGYDHKILQNCGDRLCKVCGGRRVRRLVMLYRDFISRVREERLRFITVSMKNDLDGFESMKKFDRCFHEFVDLLRARGYVEGGCYGIHLTNSNEGKGWHPNGHIIAEGKFLPQELASQWWKEVTGDSWTVWINTITKSQMNVLVYILGYCADGRGVSPELVGEYNQIMKGRRLFQTFGTWYGDMRQQRVEFRCPKCGASWWVYASDLLNILEPIIEMPAEQSP